MALRTKSKHKFLKSRLRIQKYDETSAFLNKERDLNPILRSALEGDKKLSDDHLDSLLNKGQSRLNLSQSMEA